MTSRMIPRQPLPEHSAMVMNVYVTYQRATVSQREAGRRWYPLAGDVVNAIAKETGQPDYIVARVIAALSPRNPWAWNVADAHAYCDAATHGRTMPSATTFGNNQRAAWRILTEDREPWHTDASKVRAFVAAVTGSVHAVVVDVWAIRVATNGAQDFVGGKARYEAIAAAYREAAARLGETPRDLQAITWIVARDEGLGSKRAGRIDTVHKAGTPQFVRDLLVP